MSKTIKIMDGAIQLFMRTDRPSKYWQARFYVDGTKRPLVRSTKKTDLQEASDWARKEIFKLTGKAEEGISLTKHTFKQAAEIYIKKIESEVEAGNRPKVHIKNYVNPVNRYFITFFGNKRIDRIDTDTLKEYCKWRKDYWLKGNGSTETEFTYIRRGKTIKSKRTPKPSNPSSQEGVALKGIFDVALKRGWLLQEQLPEIATGVASSNRRPAFSSGQYEMMLVTLPLFVQEGHSASIREKAAQESQLQVPENPGIGQSLPVHFKEATPCILSVNETDPYPCKLTAPENKMHGVLEGNSSYWHEQTEDVLNTPCIEARIGGFNAAGVNVPSEQTRQQEQSICNGAGAIPDQKIQRSQQASKICKGAAGARKLRTHKPIAHAHLKMSSDYRCYGLREVHLQLWHNAPNSGQALFTGKLEYKLLRGDETRFQYCDFQTQRKFRGTLNKPKSRPGRYTKGDPKRFIDEGWYVELNQYLLHQNQLRGEHGLPELLVSHSQRTERSKKGNIVWVHREERRVLLLFRDTKGRPQKVQMVDGRFAIDFPVLNPDISVEDGSPDWRATWYRE